MDFVRSGAHSNHVYVRVELFPCMAMQGGAYSFHGRWGVFTLSTRSKEGHMWPRIAFAHTILYVEWVMLAASSLNTRAYHN
jgi:hypothetical protein